MSSSSNRREKSLTKLCQKFLSICTDSDQDPTKPNQNTEPKLIYLDRMVELLEVERRRIYDIVNVLESVEILSRHSKNQYLWHGFSQIHITLSKLKTLAVKTNFLEYAKKLMMSQLDDDLHHDTRQAENVSYEPTSYNGTTMITRNRSETNNAATQTFNVSREEKSLGIMCQKFLMLFLTSEDGVVSINFAARVLLGDTKNDVTEHGRFKTKIRRLYDIANVLVSIDLIKKYHGINVSRPAYIFIGPQVSVIREFEYVSNFVNEANPNSNSKHSLFDHFKRRLNLESKIPNFDIQTGTLNPKVKRLKVEPSEQIPEQQQLQYQPEYQQYIAPMYSESSPYYGQQYSSPAPSYQLHTSSSSSSSISSHYGSSMSSYAIDNSPPLLSVWQSPQSSSYFNPAMSSFDFIGNSTASTSTSSAYYIEDNGSGWIPLPSFSSFFN